MHPQVRPLVIRLVDPSDGWSVGRSVGRSIGLYKFLKKTGYKFHLYAPNGVLVLSGTRFNLHFCKMAQVGNNQPVVSMVFLFLKGAEIESDPSAGIIISTHSLVLQGVNRNTSGEYICQVIRRGSTFDR